MPQFYDQLIEALADGEPFALGLISGIKRSRPEKKGRNSLPVFAFLLAGCLFPAGCASPHVESNTGTAAPLSERLTFYTVPFR